jgi:ribosome biogenesis protein MAK21
MPYLTHFHPSVSVSAQNLLRNENIPGKPDLTIHTLSHFLDRFVYRNPKASSGLRGSSIMQPLAGGDGSGLLVTAGRGMGQEPVNSESFWKKRSNEVAAEDAFFHDYFSLRGKDKSEARKTKKKAAEKGQEGSGEDEDDEEEIWQALVESRPEVEGHDSDDDLDMDDLESAFDEESGDDEEVGEGMDLDDEEGHDDDADDAKADEPSDDEDAFDMDVSDEEAFLGSDDELPTELDGGVELPSAGKEEKALTGRQKKRKLKHLPTFASMEDYAALLENE